MQKLEIVSMVKINGVWMKQDEVEPDEFARLLETKLDRIMQDMNFERTKTA